MLSEIFNHEDFMATALESLNMAAPAPKQARYHSMIIEMNIVMPEDM